jgi:hypothetical protein
VTEPRAPLLPLPVALGAAAALVVAETAAHLVDFGVYGLRVGLLDADSDAGLFPWLETLLLVAGALLAVTRARTAPVHGWRFAALAAGLAFVAAGSRLHLRDTAEGPWLYAPVLAAVALLLWAALPGRQARPFVVAALACLAVSLGIHELAPPLLARVGSGPGDWVYEVKIALKQATELAGWTLVACALASDLRLRRRLRPARAA